MSEYKILINKWLLNFTAVSHVSPGNFHFLTWEIMVPNNGI